MKQCGDDAIASEMEWNEEKDEESAREPDEPKIVAVDVCISYD